MSDIRNITYPADALQRVVERLQDEFPNLPGEDAQRLGFDLTIEVVNGTDRLRAIEAAEKAAANDATALRSVEQVCGVWEIRVRVQHGVVGMSGGTFNASGPEGSSHGVLINAPDAAALRSLIGDLGRALDEIEGRG